MKNIERAKEMLETTDLTLEQICADLGVSMGNTFKPWYISEYPEEWRNARKRRMYSLSKFRENPMLGKTGVHHPRYKGIVSDGKGYCLVLKPNWWIARAGSRHIFQHQVVFAEKAGLNHIPDGFVVHHINGNKEDNDVSNLALVAHSAHKALHRQLGWLQGAETILNGSSRHGKPAKRTPSEDNGDSDDDIVQ